MKYLGKTTLLIALLTFACMAQAEKPSADIKKSISKSKRADIEKLLELTGALRIGSQMSQFFVTEMTKSIKTARPDIPEEMFKVLAEEVNGVINGAMKQKEGFVDLVIPVYDKYYSDADIKALIKFYQSDIGKKTIKVMPNLIGESMKIGQAWGQKLGPVIEERVMKRFKEKGFDLAA